MISCPSCQFASDLGSSIEIKKFLDGPDNGDMSECEHGLVHKYGATLGQIWSALATFKGPPGRRRDEEDSLDEGDESHHEDSGPRRARMIVTHSNYADSSTMQVGSSSPIDQDSQSQGTSSVGYVGPESHVACEDDTVRLISCVIRHILYFGPPPLQDLGSTRSVVEFRDAQTRLTAIAPLLGRKITASDDMAGSAYETIRTAFSHY